MEAEILGAENPAWLECLGQLPHDFYHHPLYVGLEGERIQAIPEAFLARDGEKVFLLPYLVRSCNSLFPTGSFGNSVTDVISPYGFPGVLLNDAGREPEFARRALQAFRQTLQAKGVCSGFFRMHPILNQDLRELFPAQQFTDNGITVAIDLLQDEETLWQGMVRTHRVTINKCVNAGFTPRVVPLADYLDEFIDIYDQTMKRVKAKPNYYFNRSYFQRLAAMTEHVHCCIVEGQGQVSAACIILECSGITQAHLGGTKNDFLSKSPFHLLLHHAALWAKGRGNRYLHLGGGVGGANDQLLRFKSGFSSRTFPFSTLRLRTNEAHYGQMVELRAGAINVPVDTLLESSFFPAYRAME